MPPRFWSQAFLALLLVCTSFLPCFAAAATNPYGVGQLAAPLTGTDQYGSPFRLRNQLGKWVVLHYTSNFGSYRRQGAMAAEAQGLSDTLHAAGVPFTYLTVLLRGESGFASTALSSAEWAARYKLTEPVIFTPQQNPSRSLAWNTLHLYRISAGYSGDSDLEYLPLTVLINPEGKVAEIILGVVPAQYLLNRIGHPELTAPPALPEGFPVSFTLSARYGDRVGSRAVYHADEKFPADGESPEPFVGNLPSNYLTFVSQRFFGSTFLIWVNAEHAFSEDVGLPRFPVGVPLGFGVSNLVWPAEPYLVAPTNLPLEVRDDRAGVVTATGARK